MNLKNTANAIIASVMGSPQLEDADRDIVLRQLQELHRASLEEAAKLVCLHCRKGLERKVPELVNDPGLKSGACRRGLRQARVD